MKNHSSIVSDTSKVLTKLGDKLRNKEIRVPIGFQDFLQLASEHPQRVFRDIFQVFYDM
ncbi:MAG: hypothetical protein HC880_06065, partial [Bacteroidia bacterium]|nr:hypothetical protein [Bacteroidia bacterium]